MWFYLLREKKLISHHDVLAMFDYKGGELVHRFTKCSVAQKGQIAGTIDASNGYRKIGVGNKRYYAHRLVWLYFNGVLPKQNIDHIDGNRLNNSIENLRDVAQTKNAQNQRVIRRNNSTGFTGVHFYKSRNQYTAKICIDGKTYHLGYFKTALAASRAYKAAQKELKAGFIWPSETS